MFHLHHFYVKVSLNGGSSMGLHISNVSKSFGDRLVVNSVTFNMDQPGVFGLLGTNGAGKTTTIRMILGILEKDSGKIDWNDHPVDRETVRFGYLPEERGLYPKARIDEQLLYFARLRGLSKVNAKASLEYWLERLKMTEYAQRPGEQL